MNRGGGGNVFLTRRSPEGIIESGCQGTAECLLGGVADHVLVFGWLLVMVAVAIGSLVFLPRARGLCDEEQRRTRAEYEAFDRFVGRVREISPVGQAQTLSIGTGGAVMQGHADAPAGGSATIRDAYVETVMDVPHFDEEYGETAIEHMQAELGDEVAMGIHSASTVTQPLRRSVLDAAAGARARRERFLALLDDESDSLAGHEETLRELDADTEDVTAPLRADQSFGVLRRRHERLSRVEDRIERVVNDRQSDRTTGRSRALGRSIDLQAYLYRPMEVTYPVVAEAANLLSRVHVTRERVEDELIYRS